MHIFEVIGAGTSAVTIFATSYDEAVRLYMVYWLARENRDLPDLEVKQRNSAWPGLNFKALDHALASGVSGIGRFDPNKGWTIVSPTDGAEEA